MYTLRGHFGLLNKNYKGKKKKVIEKSGATTNYYTFVPVWNSDYYQYYFIL